MHVDGFRFDLASALARNHSGFNTLHPFFQVIQQDPVLSQVKLIAEPWDVGEGGYQVGQLSRALVGMERQISRLASAVFGKATKAALAKWPID